jgi:hypothetical protein
VVNGNSEEDGLGGPGLGTDLGANSRALTLDSGLKPRDAATKPGLNGVSLTEQQV